MKLYRICTEATGEMRQRAIDAMDARFDGFTVLDAMGYWKGTPEASVILEVYAMDMDVDKVLDVAREIRDRNCQEVVLVQIIGATEHWVRKITL